MLTSPDDHRALSQANQRNESYLEAYRQAVKASAKATTARAALPPGTSRARVTTANARWARAAEHRDLLLGKLRDFGVQDEYIKAAEAGRRLRVRGAS